MLVGLGEENGVSLPPGSYVAHGTVIIWGGASQPQCILWNQDGDFGFGTVSYGVPNVEHTMPLVHAFTVDAPTKVYVTCLDDDSTPASPIVVITKVETLHQGFVASLAATARVVRSR